MQKKPRIENWWHRSDKALWPHKREHETSLQIFLNAHLCESNPWKYFIDWMKIVDFIAFLTNYPIKKTPYKSRKTFRSIPGGPVDVGFLLDSSNSLYNNYGKEKQFIIDMVASMKPGSRAGECVYWD